MTDTASLDSGLSVKQPPLVIQTRAYQQELLDESLRKNLIIALDTGSGKTHIAVLRMKLEAERDSKKISWFVAPTVALIEQQHEVIAKHIPFPVCSVTGASQPDQWKDASLWRKILSENRILVTTPQILYDALNHGYITLGEIGLLVFDEAHHATAKHPYNAIMNHFYFALPARTDSDDLDARVRPMILGLTASPIYGGNVDKAFKELERNLDSTIRSSRFNRDELATFVHRPVFKHILYPLPSYEYEDIPFLGPSANVIALQTVVTRLNIEDDPYVISLRRQLARQPSGAQRTKLDQKLSSALSKADTFTHKGLRDFARAAQDICYELGPWAADWYVATVIEQARTAAKVFNSVMATWQDSEKLYLLKALADVNLSPFSENPQLILTGVSTRVHKLVEYLKEEEAETRSRQEPFSGIIFVTRRDSVLALAEVLSRLPETSELFRIGCLLGSSQSSKRHSFLDLTRAMLKDPASDTLRDFRIGDKNLIVSTSVAEEGLDIQACGCVIRFDPPMNMVAWAQSRGRARRKKSSFVIMFSETLGSADKVKQWEEMERQMMARYSDEQRDRSEPDGDDFENDMEFRVESTGALMTLHSVMSHLQHFCAVLPRGYDAHVPYFDLDPPDFPEGWHGLGPRPQPIVEGPWSATCILPRVLPPDLRSFSTPFTYKSKRSARCHAAFLAYIRLYRAGLLSDNLLPISSVITPDGDGEVKILLQEVEQRAGTANVPIQMDPWSPSTHEETWWAHELRIEGLPVLRMLTRSALPHLAEDEFPVLYVPGKSPLVAQLKSGEKADISAEVIAAARSYTLRLFTSLYGPRMDQNKEDLTYLFLPLAEEKDDKDWEERRRWMEDRVTGAQCLRLENAGRANADALGKQFSYPLDLALVRANDKISKVLEFIGWHDGPISAEEEEGLKDRYDGIPDVQITYPLLIARPYPRRTNFLVPLDSDTAGLTHEYPLLLFPAHSTVDLISREEVQLSMVLPSFLRWLAKAMTVWALKKDLFASTPLKTIPLQLLMTALTAPCSQEATNYQRLETLGDTVLKYIVSIQLFSQYPLWHEGYLTRRKDHAINNNKLAKEAIRTRLYQWIIRDRFVPKKWRPRYLSDILVSAKNTTDNDVLKEAEAQDDAVDADAKSEQKTVVNKKKNQNLSTKVLADVVESLIGASYEHGGFDLAIKCAEVFDLGLPSWDTVSRRVEVALSRIEQVNNLPAQLSYVERMLGYEFSHKILLVEALTHASYQGDLENISYERLEFLGDSALDMVVTDFMYHAPGKNYSPGYMHIHKEALVNSHFLAFICMNTSLVVDASMPVWDAATGVSIVNEQRRIHLWQCLLHSSSRVLDDQTLTSDRYQKKQDYIRSALKNDSIYPWATLTSLQAPKFISDMIESLLGAIFLDSHGDLNTIRGVLKTLGIYAIMERIVDDDVDVLHPVSRLGIWGAKQDPQKKVHVKMEKEDGNISCVVLVDDEEIARATEKFRGKSSRNDVRFTAAEDAIRKLRVIEQETPEDVDVLEWPEELPEYDW